MTALADYYFAHDEMFVVPIEHLSPVGTSEWFRRLFLDRVSLGAQWLELFDESFATYWQRVADLARRAPKYWFPPRLQHVCVVTAPTLVRPYFQPFNKSSWLLYAADFDPATSNCEFAAFQFVQAERMGLLQEVTQTVVRNLSYWLLRSDAEIERFQEACQHSRRPDAAAHRTLAEALRWVRRLNHESLTKPIPVASEVCVGIPHTGLLAPGSLRAHVDGLGSRWGEVAQGAVAEFHAVHARRGRDRAGELCAWLRERQPRLLITGPDGRVLWDPDAAECIRAVRAALGGIGAAAAASIRADLEIIDAHTRRFLASLLRPNDLPAPHPDTVQNGLSYLHVARKLIAYNLREPGMERLHAPAPPYERFMLGARTIHEWGHLAADAGWIPLVAERAAEHQECWAALGGLFDEIYAGTPASMRAYTAGEMVRLRTEAGSLGRGLASITLRRLPDYQANLLARHYLSFAECETYIRNNVYNLSLESRPTAVFQRLARYVYEYQYLRFSQITDPLGYFLHSTWFAEEYVERRILTEEQLRQLLAIVGKVCSCYAVDWSNFNSEFRAAVARADELQPAVESASLGDDQAKKSATVASDK